MQKKKVKNPPFPHSCRVYKVQGETAWDDGKEEVLYEGECMVQPPSSTRIFKTGGTIKTEFSLFIPKLVRGVGTGCLVDYEDYTGKYSRITVGNASPGEMGTTIHFETPKN